MNIIIVTQPPVPAVSLEEIYTFLRLDPDTADSPPSHPDDAMLMTMLESATELVEQATNRALVEQTVRLVLPWFQRPLAFDFYPDRNCDRPFYTDRRYATGIELWRPPFIEMVSVKYLDGAGDEQTLDPASYRVSAQAIVPKLTPITAWPSTLGNCEDAVRIEYKVGYAPELSPLDYTANIPRGLKAAVKFETQLQYDPVTPEQRTKIEAAIARLVASNRVAYF